MMCLMGDTDERIRSMGDRAIKKKNYMALRTKAATATFASRFPCTPSSLLLSAVEHDATALRSPANCTHTALRACLKYSMDNT
jgi:hypothetical protein